MIYKIKKGSHRAFPPSLWLYHNKTEFIWKVKFNSSAVYDIGDDQLDINKLCGIGYFPSHHTDSARFGWRYRDNKIELLTYCYDKGKNINLNSNEKLVAKINLNVEYTLKLNIISDTYYFEVWDDIQKIGYAEVPKTHIKKWGYKLGLFFGGNQPAPHDITVSISKA